ncbi:MAG TPA: hypothetical protein VGC91_01580 [Pyrinomonadaceae bacterium]|jgi:hypothetical protein
MAKDQSKKLDAAVMAADEHSFAALQAITAYKPANEAFSISALTEAQRAFDAAKSAQAQAEAAAATARDVTVEKAWIFHNLILGMKDQIRAQFGKDSTEVQAVGLKRTSEYKSRQRKPAKSKS